MHITVLIIVILILLIILVMFVLMKQSQVVKSSFNLINSIKNMMSKRSNLYLEYGGADPAFYGESDEIGVEGCC